MENILRKLSAIAITAVSLNVNEAEARCSVDNTSAELPSMNMTDRNDFLDKGYIEIDGSDKRGVENCQNNYIMFNVSEDDMRNAHAAGLPGVLVVFNENADPEQCLYAKKNLTVDVNYHPSLKKVFSVSANVNQETYDLFNKTNAYGEQKVECVGLRFDF